MDLADRVKELEQQLSAAQAWRTAVEEELIVCGIFNESHNDPKKALNDAIQWHVGVALDPQVSQQAMGLINQGKLLADAAAQANELRLRELLVRLSDTVEALDGTSIENERLVDDYRATLATPLGDMTALREVIAQVLDEAEQVYSAEQVRSGEWTPEVLK